MAGIPVTGTLTPDGSFSVVDVAHVANAESATVAHSYADSVAESRATAVAVTRVAHVATVTALRAATTLPEDCGGRAHLTCHTTAGWGGGPLYWGAYGTDDNGTIFCVTGRTDGAWRRSDAINVCSFGAVGDYNHVAETGVDSTAAILACRAWSVQDPKNRPVIFPSGTYCFAGSFELYSEITLTSDGMALIWRPTNTGGHMFATSSTAYQCANSNISKLWLSGGASAGESIFNIVAMLAGGHWDVQMTGGFTYGIRSIQGGILDPNYRGAIQCMTMRLDGYRRTQTPGNRVPANFFYMSGPYCNGNDMWINASVLTGVAVYIHSNGGGGYSRWSGNTEACLRSFDLQGVSDHEFVRWFDEASTNPSLVDSCIAFRYTQGSSEITFTATAPHMEGHLGSCTFADAPLSLNKRVYPPPILGGRNLDELNITTDNFGISRFDAATAYPGQVDPAENLALNGDFSRWTATSGQSPLAHWYYYYTAEKCGVGCTDTTQTLEADNCALLKPDARAGGDKFFFNLPLIETVPAALLGCPVIVSLKIKEKTETGSHLFSHLIIQSGLAGGSGVPLGPISVENGFILQSFRQCISQEHIDHGLHLGISGISSSEWYISEVQAHIAWALPRSYHRAGRRFGFQLGELESSGSTVTWVDSVPTSPTNTLLYSWFGTGADWLSGDRALLRSPVTADNHGRSMTLTGWEYSGSTWVPQYVVASSDAQAYADFTLQETDPPYAQGRFFVNSEGVPCVQMSPSVTAQLPEEVLVRVKTDDGALADGTVVYASGGQGNNLLVKKLATGLTQLSSKLIGLTTEAVTDTGRATSFGLVHGLNTLAHPAGTCLYTSGTAGALTSTMPPGDVDGAAVCLVTRQHQNDGTVFVHPRTLDRLSGTTANRPVSPRKGTLYWDETLNSIVVWTGAAWALAIPAGYTDLLGTFDSSTATADLTYEAYRDTPLRMPWLHRSQDDAISLHYQMPHNWTLTAVEPHVHIIQGAATGGDLVLDGRLAWSRSGVSNLPAWASWTPFRVKTTLSATQWTHTMISLGTFTPPAGALYPSASLHVWLRRPGSADAEDTYDGDKVGGPTTAANIGLEYVDCHVQVQGFGTVTAT